MATLKTVQAGALQIPMQGARIDASVFGDSSGANAVAQGLNNLSQGLQSVSRDNQAINMHLKQLGDTQYLSKLSAEATKYSGEFLDDPNNAADPDFHKTYEKHMQKFAAVWTSAAPSKEAKIHAQAHVDQIAAGGYNVALKTVVQKKIKDTALALEQGLNGEATMVAQMLSSDSVAAEEMLNSAIGKYRNDVETNFGKTAPAMAAQLLERGAVNTIDRVLSKSPTLARKLLEDSDLDGQTYSTMLTKIQHVENANNHGAQVAVQDMADRLERAAMNGVGTAQALTEEDFAPFGDRAHTVYLQHKQKMDNIKEADDEFNKLAGVHPARQAESIASYIDANPLKIETHHILQQKSRESAALFQKDVVQWLDKYNPVIGYRAAQVRELAAMNAPKEEQLAARHQLNEDRLNIQGPPPEGSVDVRTQYFLNLPTPHLLSETSAKSIAETLNNAKGTDAVQQIIGDLMNMYPGDHFAIMASDLKAMLPAHEQPKIAIQAAFANMGQPWLPGFLSSQFNREANKGLLSDKVKTDLATQVATNPEILKWSKAYGDSEGRNFAEVQSAVGDYAMELSVRGSKLDPKIAVETAAKNIFGSTRHMISVGSNDVIIPKTGKINDTTVERVPALLGKMTEALDISSINTAAHFPTFKLFEDPAQEEAAIRSAMQMVGHWAVSPDERSLQFRMRGDDGKPYVITDLNGDPIQVDIEDIGDVVSSGKEWFPADVSLSGLLPQDVFQIGLPSSRTGIKNKSNFPFRK